MNFARIQLFLVLLTTLLYHPTNPKKRTLLRVKVVEKDVKETRKSIERLMGNKAELRFEFIQERAEFADDAALDV